SEDDNGNRRPFLVGVHGGEEFEAVHFGHHEIQQDDPGVTVGKTFEGFAAVGRHDDDPAFGSQLAANHFAGGGVVFHDERSRGDVPAIAQQNSRKALAIDRFSQVLGSAEGIAQVFVVDDRHHHDWYVGEFG